MKIHKWLVGILAAVLLCSSAQAAEIPSARGDIFAMDTYMSMQVYGEAAQIAVDRALAEITRLDNELSIGISSSAVSNINREGQGTLSTDLAVLTETAVRISRETDGAFDITILPLMELWGFTTQEFRVPGQSEISTVLALVDSSAIVCDAGAGTISLAPQQRIDFGGIAKGYASDRLMRIFRESGVVSGAVTLGGNVHCFGTKPDGSKWRVGIQDPQDPTGYMGICQTADRAVITSGPYERNFTDPASGKVYHHIIDPATGYPAQSGLISATIVSESGIVADALSTACFVMGVEGASEFWRSGSEDFEMILMTEDRTVYITEGLETDFTTGCALKVIRKA